MAAWLCQISSGCSESVARQYRRTKFQPVLVWSFNVGQDEFLDAIASLRYLFLLHSNHQANVIWTFEDLNEKTSRSELNHSRSPKLRELATHCGWQAEDGLFPDEKFNEFHIVFDVREKVQVKAHHHVHGTLWFLGFETRQILELVVGDLGIFL